MILYLISCACTLLAAWRDVPLFTRSSHATNLELEPPTLTQVSEKQLYEAEKQFKIYESMINAMDEEERVNPDVLAKSPSRRRRVALVSAICV